MLMLALLTLSLASCKKDKECEEWHEGPDCSRMTAKFTGTWNGTYDCSGNFTGNTSVYIYQKDHPRAFVINEAGVTYEASLTSSTAFNIPSQTVQDGGISYTMSGFGWISGNTLTIEQSATIQGTFVSCTNTLTQ